VIAMLTVPKTRCERIGDVNVAYAVKA